MHTVIGKVPDMHTGMVQSLTSLHMVVICIWGFGHQIPICQKLHVRISVDRNLHARIYCKKVLKICIWGSLLANGLCMHMVINTYVPLAVKLLTA